MPRVPVDLNGPQTAIITRMHQAGKKKYCQATRATQRMAFRRDADGFPGCRVEHYTESGKYGYSWKIFLNDVQMGVIILTTQARLPEDKIRAHFRVELRQKIGQPAPWAADIREWVARETGRTASLPGQNNSKRTARPCGASRWSIIRLSFSEILGCSLHPCHCRLITAMSAGLS